MENIFRLPKVYQITILVGCCVIAFGGLAYLTYSIVKGFRSSGPVKATGFNMFTPVAIVKSNSSVSTTGSHSGTLSQGLFRKSGSLGNKGGKKRRRS